MWGFVWLVVVVDCMCLFDAGFLGCGFCLTYCCMLFWSLLRMVALVLLFCLGCLFVV